MEKSYINLFTLEQLNKYGLTKDDQNKIAVLVNKAINEELYTSTKDFQHNLLHIERVIAYICMIANKLNSEDIDLELLLTAALYHDIGKTLGASNKMHGFVGAKQFLDNHVGDLDYKKAKTGDAKLDKFFDNATIYFSKSTNLQTYKYVNILEYHDGNYVLTNPISEINRKEMKNNMDEQDAKKFEQFCKENWN